MHAASYELSILTAEHPAERRVFVALVAMLAVLLAGYLYCVSASVLNVIARKEAVAKSASLESAIGALEQEYFSYANDVTPATGATLGLAPVVETSYVHRPGAVASAISSDEVR